MDIHLGHRMCCIYATKPALTEDRNAETSPQKSIEHSEWPRREGRVPRRIKKHEEQQSVRGAKKEPTHSPSYKLRKRNLRSLPSRSTRHRNARDLTLRVADLNISHRRWSIDGVRERSRSATSISLIHFIVGLQDNATFGPGVQVPQTLSGLCVVIAEPEIPGTEVSPWIGTNHRPRDQVSFCV